MAQNFFIIPVDNNDKKFIGSKGENLRILSENGFIIPLTYCITTKAYKRFVDDNHFDRIISRILKDGQLTSQDRSQKIFSLILAGNIPKDMQEGLASYAYLTKTHTQWAVRSSSNLEDLPMASFSGLYDSYLNIHGLDNIIDSIKKCWASLWNERAMVYRENNKLGHDQCKMAVIIQEMVDAQYSGVMFTKHPDPEKENKMILEYSEGLGEGLVSGRMTPYSCEIHKSIRKIYHMRVPAINGLSDKRINELSNIALKVEKYFGEPQDIEWAFDGKEIYLLQTRPITGSNFKSMNTIDDIWTRANIGEVLPSVITPFTWDIFRATLFNCPQLVAKGPQNGHIFEDSIKLINGRCYLKLKFFLNSFCYLPYVTPQVMKHVLGVDVVSQTSSYMRSGGILVKLAQCLFILDAFKILPRISLMLKRLPDIPSQHIANLEKLIQWNAQCFHLHIKCTAYSIGAFALLSHNLQKWIPSEAEKFLTLILTGKENLQTAKQGVSLWEIANFISQRKELKDIVQRNFNWSQLTDELKKVKASGQLLTMLHGFLNMNGARAAEEFELSIPRWKEDPSFIIEIITKYLNIADKKSVLQDISFRNEQRDKAIGSIRSSLGMRQRFIFSRMLASYKDYCTLRENIKYRLMEGYSVIRGIFLTIGTRLESEELMESKDDIFFLRPYEIISILNGKQPANEIKDLIIDRKAQHMRWESQHAPELIFKSGIQIQTQEGSNNLLKGIGCSPGIVEGYARVLKDISEMKFLQPGEILVTSHTDPGWTPLFLSCKAIVTEIGGFLSHGATVAREYGIPAVVGVNNALMKIHTGDFMQVNGTDGQVIIYDNESFNS